MPTPAALPSILIFAGTYLVLALGRLPGFRVGRTGAAIIGATLMVAVNALTLPEAVEAINTDTILGRGAPERRRSPRHQAGEYSHHHAAIAIGILLLV